MNQQVIILSGQAEAGSKVSLYINGKPVGVVISDENGRFIQDGVSLIEGENQFSGVATDLAGNISSESELGKLLVDVRAPLIGNPVPAPSSRVKSGRFGACLLAVVGEEDVRRLAAALRELGADAPHRLGRVRVAVLARRVLHHGQYTVAARRGLPLGPPILDPG